MRIPIRLPDLGAGPVLLSCWYGHPGDELFEGERLVEVLADGITFDVAAPATGRLVQQLAFVDDVLAPGQTLGIMEVPDENVRP